MPAVVVVGSTAVGSTVASTVPHARELLAEFKATGDDAAFEEIVRRYAGMVFGVCLRTTKNPHDAEDATQAVFLSLAVQCKTGDGVKFVGPWLQQVAKRVSLDIKRSKKRRETREQRHHAMNGHANGNGNGHTPVEKNGAAVDVDDLKGVLGEELNQLPSKYRLPLILHYFGGMTRDEMARELNCKPATLGVRIHRGREMLGRRLHERGAAPPGLVLSAGMITLAVRHCVSDALVARTVEAACKLGTGHDLGAHIAGNVLAMTKTAAAGAALAAKLKAVAAVVIALCLTGLAGGAVAKLAPFELKVPQFLKFNWLPKFRTMVPTPSFSSAREAPASANAAEPNPVRVAVALQPAPAPIAPAPTAPTSVAGPVASAAPVTVQPKPVAKTQAARRAVTTAADGESANAKPLQPQTSAETAVAQAADGVSAPESATPETDVVASGDVVAKAETASDDGAKSPTYLSIAAGGGGSVGSMSIFGGNVQFDVQNIGERGTGLLEIVGGSNTFKYLRIGGEFGSRGTVRARGNAVLRAQRASDPDAPSGVVVGDKGTGELFLGDGDSTGNVMAVGEPTPGVPEPSLIVRADELGSGKIEGHGTINLGGILENNGETIANGYGHGRTLDFDGFTQVVNTIENVPVGGTHGWFAKDGARLALPRIPMQKGTHTYTWGESPDDDTIDLVNSSRITLHDAPADGFLEVSLHALDRGGIPPLPRGHTFIGVWQMETFTVSRDPETGVLTSTPIEPGGLDLIVRYDDALAAQLGLDENILKLWKYQDGQWSRVLDGFQRNPDLNLLSGHVDGAISYYAVSAPEPGTAALVMLGGSAVLLTRRRRRQVTARA